MGVAPLSPPDGFCLRQLADVGCSCSNHRIGREASIVQDALPALYVVLAPTGARVWHRGWSLANVSLCSRRALFSPEKAPPVYEGTKNRAYMAQFLLCRPMRRAFRMTASESPMSPTATASHRLTRPGNASTAKIPLMAIEATMFSFITATVR